MNAETLQSDSTAVAAGSATPAEAAAGRGQPLVDRAGAPLLPQVAAAIRAGATLPPLPAGRTRSVLDAGDFFPAVDATRLATYVVRGRQLQGQATAEILLGLFGIVATVGRRVVRALARTGSRFFAPAPSADEVRRVLAPNYRGVLDLNRNYEQERARYFGRGL